MDEIPADVAAQLALLDEDEASIALTRAGGATLVYLMLCERDPLPEADDELAADVQALTEEDVPREDLDLPAPTREQIEARLRNARLQAYADAYLDELRAEVDVEVLVAP